MKLSLWYVIAFSMCIFSLGISQEGKLNFDRQPYLQSLAAHAVVVVSQSEIAKIAKIAYWKKGDETLFTISENEDAHDHVFHLNDLEPNTRYAYQVSFRDGTNWPAFDFSTFPLAGSDALTTIAVVGDTGYLSGDGLVPMAEVIASFSPNAILHTGDLVYPMGEARLYQYAFFDIYRDTLSQACIFPTLGNHDCQWSIEPWTDIFLTPANNDAQDKTYYSFNMGDAHFAALNTCSESVPKEQLAWLDKDLSQTSLKWKIIFFHHAPYSTSRESGAWQVREDIVPLIDKYKVDLVFSGHGHAYERFFPLRGGFIFDDKKISHYENPQGTVYIVTGGGGASLYEQKKDSKDISWSALYISEHHALSMTISKNAIDVKAIGKNKEVFDWFTVKKDDIPKPLLEFIRGDANQSGEVGISDAITLLEFLFLGEKTLCLAACDADSSGDIDITDPIFILHFLFVGGSKPTYPFPWCGSIKDAPSAGCVELCG